MALPSLLIVIWRSCRTSNQAGCTRYLHARRGRFAAFCAAAAALAAVTVAGWGQSALEQRIARVEQGLLPRAVPKGEVGKRASIAERMAYHGVPGMSIAVIENGQIVWARGYGDREGQGRVTPDTLFQAASISKTVTAVGALLLVQRQHVELDTDVRRWFQWWNPGAPVTLRQLLSHTAGLTVSGFAGYAPGAPLPTVPQILSGQTPANNSPVRTGMEPGTKVQYSGGGYVAVQQLIAESTQIPFDEYIRSEVFRPLEMTRSRFEQPLSKEGVRLAAIGYRRDGSRVPGNWMVHPELAAAGLWTTPTDLARLIIEVQDAAAGRPTRALAQASAREMLTGRIDNAGLGCFLTGPNGASRRFMHSGRNAGFDALLVAYKNGRQGAVVMINHNNNGGFVNEVIESVAREYAWPDYVPVAPQREYEAVPAAIQRRHAGVYEAPEHPPVTVVFEDDKLFARVGEGAWLRLYPASAAEFFVTENAARWLFVKSSDGRADEVVVRSENREIRRRRRP
jgi:CubicO group peptidase (beta-lactamase class C family)